MAHEAPIMALFPSSAVFRPTERYEMTKVSKCGSTRPGPIPPPGLRVVRLPRDAAVRQKTIDFADPLVRSPVALFWCSFTKRDGGGGGSSLGLGSRLVHPDIATSR